MTERSKFHTVTFKRPFTLESIEGTSPPGRYEIETTEALIPDLSFPAYQRISTTITLPVPFGASTARQVFAITPAELEAALERDAAD